MIKKVENNKFWRGGFAKNSHYWQQNRKEYDLASKNIQQKKEKNRNRPMRKEKEWMRNKKVM
ncbi:hypothetical protein CN958_30295 [Bacillus cereus]|uniref:Uncharacterized protein n=1 Tax=Bacillus cereus TaxID=1396 RepID=A0A2B9DIL5_BACCE|nr:hypothetical protein CN958_30295 [Bacillus cereus]